MKKIIYISILFSMVFLFTGCEELFEFNLFSRFDTVSLPDNPKAAASEDPDGFVDTIEDALESGTLDELGDEEIEEIVEGLETIYDNSALDTGTRQDAAILAADVVLDTSDAGDVTDNFSNALGDLISEEGGEDDGEGDEVKTILSAVFGTDREEDDFIKIINDMKQAAEAYTAFGNSLEDKDGDGTADPPEDLNMGEIAQKALIVMMVDFATETVTPEDLYGYLYNDEDIEEVSDPFEDESNTAFINIMEAAGLNELF